MIYAFRESSALATSELMQSIFALRHRIFVFLLNWKSLQRANGLERDEFDHEDAIHIALIQNGQVSAYSRLLPTVRAHLLSDVYPELMQGRASPRGPGVWEWTRLCALPDPETGKATPIRLMMVAVAEICMILRSHKIIAQSDPGWTSRLNRLGWDAKPLMIPMIYNGSVVVPLEARVSRATIKTSRQRLGVRGDILDYSNLTGLLHLSHE